MAERKFSTSTILLSVAVFILLSGSASAQSQCYWCGPLAEQVHRSRRAPPCDAPKAHVTTCDEGFPYCAIVATAPQYIESRYCVKIYQDECYLDFCNTTKTWKMTCPCKGNLCNGQNADREEVAFAELIATNQISHKKRTKKSIKEPLIRSIQTEEKTSAVVEPDINKTNDNEPITESIENYKDIISSTADSLKVTQENITNYEENETNTNSDLEIVEIVPPTVYEVEPTVIKYLASSDANAKNLINPSEELPTAEALQSENSEAPSENEDIESTINDDKEEGTTESVVVTESISHENAASFIDLSLYSLIFLIFTKL